MTLFKSKAKSHAKGLSAPELLKQVEDLTAQGRNEDAFDLCERCLIDGSTLVDAHYMAVMILKENPTLGLDVEEFSEKYNGPDLQRAYAERIQFLQSAGRLEQALALARLLSTLTPNNTELPIVISVLCLSLGRPVEAIDTLENALDGAPGDLTLRAQYIKMLLLSGFDRYEPKIRRRIALFLKETDTVNLAFLSRLWLVQLVKDAAFSPLLQGVHCGDYDSFRKWFDSNRFETALTDDYFLDGVRNCVIADSQVERLLVYLRRRLLDYASESGPIPAWALPLAVAIAEQCFINEYVYDQTDAESKSVAALMKTLETSESPPLEVAVVAAYLPLSIVKLPKHPTDSRVQSLVRQQIEEPAEEERIKATMKTFGKIADETSQKVRAQYEEHPYPRWISCGRTPDDTDDMVLNNMDRLKPLNILVAGCATGHFPIRVGFNYPYANITGIDISLASLAYGVRKANELDIRNVEFLHGDILDVAHLKQKFDMIFSLGVLHHMGDPERGWRCLTDVLNPGGLMKIGLYPELERKHITEARRFIAANNIPGTAAGIRRMRKIVMDRPESDPIRKILPFNDFYSTSMMRDLLFHVSEQVFTIPRIKKDLDDLNLQFVRFSPLSKEDHNHYLSMFPDDPAMTNLDHWDELEHKYPDTFTGLYQFWCQKN